MKKIIIGMIAGIAIGGGGAWWWLQGDEAPTSSLSHSAGSPPIQKDASPGVKLDRARQASAGIEVTHLAAHKLAREAKGYGRVLDPTPLQISLLEVDSAEAAFEASQKEYERVRALFARDQNASARAVESAEAARRRDQAQLDGARTRLIAAWGRPLIEQRDLRSLVRSLTDFEAVLIRLDLPASEALSALPTSARIVSLASDDRSANAEFAGFATTANAQVPGQGFFFLLRGNVLGLRPEMAVSGYIMKSAEPLLGIVVPRGAVVRSEGKAWVYVQQDETTFIKKPVTLDQPLDAGWFVATGLTPDERVVVSGAQILLSEEGKAHFRITD